MWRIRSIYAMICASSFVAPMIEALFLMIGWTTVPDLNNIKGTCHGLEEKPVVCYMQEQPYGIRYVTDGNSVYQYRPVWWGGIYSVTRDGQPLGSDTCTTTERRHICLKTFIFIPDHETSSTDHSGLDDLGDTSRTGTP